LDAPAFIFYSKNTIFQESRVPLNIWYKFSRATGVKLESGKGNPTIETLRALEQVFQLGVSQLVQMAETGTVEW
jgi:transcriptional regulator with XRE-family HTH domain